MSPDSAAGDAKYSVEVALSPPELAAGNQPTWLAIFSHAAASSVDIFFTAAAIKSH
jgi:hypothetical protein